MKINIHKKSFKIFGFRTTPNYELNQKVSELHEKYPNDEIVLIAHSQGAQIASTELKNLPASITGMVHAITLGGADWIHPDLCKKVANYVNENDGISNMTNHFKKRKEEDYNVTYLPSEGGGHPLQTKNYLDALKEELSAL